MTKERLAELKTIKTASKEKTKGKTFKALTVKEKDELLETVCKLLGLM